MKKYIFIVFGLMTGMFLQGQHLSIDQAIERHDQRLDSIQQKLRHELEESLKHLPKDSTQWALLAQKALDKYADDWDYYFYAELQQFRNELGLTDESGIVEEETGIIKIIKVIRDISKEVEQPDEEQPQAPSPAPTPAPEQKESVSKTSASQAKKKKHTTRTALRIDWGMNNFFGHPAEVMYNTSHSRYFAIGLETHIPLSKGNQLEYLIGTGIRWHKLMPLDNYYHIMDGNSVSLYPYPYTLTSSKLRTSWIYGNTGFLWHPAKKFTVGLEVYARYNLGSTQKLTYIKNDFEYKIKEQSYFGQNRFNYGWGVSAGMRSWQIYLAQDQLPFFSGHTGQILYQVGIVIR